MAALCIWTNISAAVLLALAIFFYAVVYTIWLKRSTPQNIVIGGVAGALPPVIGWSAAGGPIGLEPVILFTIVFLWTPPHFWALSLNRVEEYRCAGIPMLPVVAGRQATAAHIFIYSIALALVSLLPWLLGFAGALYGAVAFVSGVVLVALTLPLRLTGGSDTNLARRIFAFSIAHLFLLFAALLIEGVMK